MLHPPKRSPRPSPSSSPAPQPPTVAGRRRAHSGSTPLSTKLDLDSAFFWLLVAFLLTAFAFVSFRDRHLSLNNAQLAEYQRRSQFLSNSTVYIVEVGLPETLLHALSRSDWKRISDDIDLVAFVWDDLPVFLTDAWVRAAEAVLSNPRNPTAISLALFDCGCVIPARYFTLVEQRLAGYECLLLPGWVLDSKRVHWLHVSDSDSCKRRNAVLGSKLAKRYRRELSEIRRVVTAYNQMPNKNNSDVHSLNVALSDQKASISTSNRAT